MESEDWLKAAYAGALGILGRLIALSRMDNKPFGWSLLWEIPVAVGMGIIGLGMAEFFGLSGFPAHAVTISVGYLGPRVVDLLFEKFLWPSSKKP